MEMFPKLTKQQVRCLAATGDDFSVLVTRVLDNNIDAPSVPVSSIAYSCPKSWVCEVPYHYPEVFQPYFADIQECVERLRAEALQLHEQARSHGRSAVGHPVRPARAHYSIEADNARNKAGDLNRRAAMLLMRRSLENSGPIDLHGLYVDEALCFLEDLVRFNRPREMVIVTGRKYNSSRLRPAVEKWLTGCGFTCMDEGPSLRAVRKSIT